MNVEFNKKIMEELMEELKDKRPVFNSEDDFKFSLTWLIKEKYRENVEIRLEKKMNNNKDALAVRRVIRRIKIKGLAFLSKSKIRMIRKR